MLHRLLGTDSEGYTHVHVIPLDIDLTDCSQTVIVPYDLIVAELKDARDIAIMNFCVCRKTMKCSSHPRDFGCIFTGVKDGREKTIYIYNVCDHQECYRELGSQAISYTTGVPAMIGAALVANGTWRNPGARTIEEFDPDPFMDMLNKWGLPWVVDENPQTVE